MTRFSISFVKLYFAERGCTLHEKYFYSCSALLKYTCSCGALAYRTFSQFRQDHRCNACREHPYTSYACAKATFEKKGCRLLTPDSGKDIRDGDILEYICSCGTKAQVPYKEFLFGRRCFNHKRWLAEQKGSDYLIRHRLIPGYSEWREAVFLRDNFQCQKCGSQEAVEAHHIFSYNLFPESRTDVTNGVTLCYECHKNFHQLYGKETTRKDLLDYDVSIPT